jgi:hypothetical protein
MQQNATKPQARIYLLRISDQNFRDFESWRQRESFAQPETEGLVLEAEDLQPELQPRLGISYVCNGQKLKVSC